MLNWLRTVIKTVLEVLYGKNWEDTVDLCHLCLDLKSSFTDKGQLLSTPSAKRLPPLPPS